MNNFGDVYMLIKVFGVVVGAVFALTLTGDIDQQGRLHLNMGVLVKVAFSALLGFLMGGWLIDFAHWQDYSYMTHGFVMMMCSVFGMSLIGILYQSIRLTTADKTLPQIVAEIKSTFKAIIK